MVKYHMILSFVIVFAWPVCATLRNASVGRECKRILNGEAAGNSKYKHQYCGIMDETVESGSCRLN